MMEADPVSETLCSLVFGIPHCGQSRMSESLQNGFGPAVSQISDLASCKAVHFGGSPKFRRNKKTQIWAQLT
jgi:hypothetical protein